MASLIDDLQEEGFVLPDFRNSNLEVARQLAASDHGNMIGDKEKKVFLVIDGLGYNLFEKVVKKGNAFGIELDDARRITTVFPSTTMNVMSSIYSGKTTAEHGLLANNVFIREYGMPVNAIGLSPTALRGSHGNKILPEFIYPKSDVISAIKGRGKKLKIIINETLSYSGMSSFMFQKEDIVKFVTFEDMLVKIKKLVESGDIDFIMAYFDMLDHAEHVFDPISEEVEESLAGYLISLERILLPALKGSGYDLIITADHGHIRTPFVRDIKILPGDKMLDFLITPPYGESRVSFFMVRDSSRRIFEEYVEKTLGNAGKLVDADELISTGIFGKKKIDEKFRYRFGTHVLIMKGDNAFGYLYPGVERKIFETKGGHGSLSADEMYVPLILV